MFTRRWSRSGAGVRSQRGQPASPLRLESLEDRCLLSGDMVIQWNNIFIEAARIAPASPVPLQRNAALVHTAIYDAVNAIDQTHTPYIVDLPAPRWASQEAATAVAAHRTLVALYPGQQATFDARLKESLESIPDGRPKTWGMRVGQAAAQVLLAVRAHDGSNNPIPYAGGTKPGQWRPTPPDFSPATNAHVEFIHPFGVNTSSQFLAPPPPEMTSAEYARDFNEAKDLGRVDSTIRTPEQTRIALDWELGVNNYRSWHLVAEDVAVAYGTSLAQNARLFALLTMAMNDAHMTSYRGKFLYGLWRPVHAIQLADQDGNPATEPDPTWLQLHTRTPPFPTYGGNAATVGASVATVLGWFFGTDEVPFTIRWAAGARNYVGFWQAAQEAADSRIYGGIHFRFDSVAGQGIGYGVGTYIVENYLLPRSGPSGGVEGQNVDGADAVPVLAAVSHEPRFTFVVAPAARDGLALFRAEPDARPLPPPATFSAGTPLDLVERVFGDGLGDMALGEPLFAVALVI